MSFKDLTKRAEAALNPESEEVPAKKLEAETSEAGAKQQVPKSKHT